MAYPVPIKSIKSNYEKKKKRVSLRSSVIEGYITEISVAMFLQIQTDIYIMINSSKISIHRFIAITLFHVVKEWPHSSGNIHE